MKDGLRGVIIRVNQKAYPRSRWSLLTKIWSMGYRQKWNKKHFKTSLCLHSSVSFFCSRRILINCGNQMLKAALLHSDGFITAGKEHYLSVLLELNIFALIWRFESIIFSFGKWIKLDFESWLLAEWPCWTFSKGLADILLPK